MPRTAKGRAAPPPPPPPSPTLASAWNDNGLYKLPSGKIARLKRPGVLAVASIAGGQNVISDATLRRLNTDTPPPQTDEERAATIRANGRAYIEVAALCFVEPRLILDREVDYAMGEIAPSDIEDDDLLWLFFEFVGGGAAHAATFRVG